MPSRMTKESLEKQITSGCFPPSIVYKVIYTSPEEKRVSPASMEVHVHGTNVPLVFSLRIKEEMCECVHVVMWEMLLRS